MLMPEDLDPKRDVKLAGYWATELSAMFTYQTVSTDYAGSVSTVDGVLPGRFSQESGIVGCGTELANMGLLG